LLAHFRRDGSGFNAVKSRANVPVTRALLKAATDERLRCRLQVVAQAGAGVDHIDVSAADEFGVAVVHTPGANADAVAEFALALMLTAIRNVARHDRASHQGRWRTAAGPLPTAGLAGSTRGIVGPGLIGRSLMVKAAAMGMRVAVFGSPRFTAADAGRLQVTRFPSLHELLARSDVVSLHAPLTPASRHLIGANQLAAMKPGAVLVNTARGGLVDEHALAAALSDPQAPIAFAAVDVVEHEHGSFASPLMGIDNCVITPHVAGMTVDAMRRAARQTADQIVRVLRGINHGVSFAGRPPRGLPPPR
jgi:D-3-phosphoglycerate dehydrogenase